MATHNLKTWPANFLAIDNGDKRAEYRKEDGDRHFEVGDVLCLEEFDPTANVRSGRKLFREVLHVVRGPEFDVPVGYCVLSIR